MFRSCSPSVAARYARTLLLLGVLSVRPVHAAVNQSPQVQITCPTPSPYLTAYTSSSVRISWAGSDPDGFFTSRVPKYKYKLLATGSPEFRVDLVQSNPDSLRRFYEPGGFATWDSCSAETTSVAYSGLTPGGTYAFAVTTYDETGDWVAPFTLSTNVLIFQVGFAFALGPKISLTGLGITYTQPSGNWSTDTSAVLTLEVPADQPITFLPVIESGPGSPEIGYRWKLDTDPRDRTVRTNDGDVQHWGSWLHYSSIDIGPFAADGVKRREHMLYVEGASGCSEEYAFLSLLPVRLVIVKPTFTRDLLVVDDTGLEPDRVNAGGIVQPHSQAWPSASELDTFLYARGGVPWLGTLSAGPPNSKPGILAGYAFDTLGTRGIVSGHVSYYYSAGTVPLSTLADYKHVIWMVDHYGGTNTQLPTHPTQPMSARRYMTQPGHQDVLAAYVAMGGEVWTLGGDAAYASLINFNATGYRNNDARYGAGKTVFSNAEFELIPCRLMYDAAHWQSEMVYQLSNSAVRRAARAVAIDLLPEAQWYGQGWNYTHPHAKPTYSLLPPTMRNRSLALGDSLPPTRLSSQASQYYSVSLGLDVEYLTQPNEIWEDANPEPWIDDFRSTLDTLMYLTGGTLASTGNLPVCMTYYHGPGTASYVHSGFPVWNYTRADVIAMFDFVLQQVWGLTRSPVDRGVAEPATADERAGPAPLPVLRR